MRILTIGGTGMLGSSMMLSNSTHNIIGTYLNTKPNSDNFIELNITDSHWVNKVINKIKPDAIVNTAAITDVDYCEENPKIANKVHVEGTQNLINACKELGIYFLYISTDSVFDGTKGNYSETDTPNPLNVYAKTKFEGECETEKYENSSIVRVNIYGYNWLPKESIIEWILHTLNENKPINLFEDVYFSPILVNSLSTILFNIIILRLTGLYHVAGAEGITKLNFGRKVANMYNLNQELINPIPISKLNLKAIRPLNPSLNCSKIEQKLNIKLQNVEEGIKKFKELEEEGYLNKLKAL